MDLNGDSSITDYQPTGRILFSSFSEGESELFVYDFSTLEVVRLTNEPERMKHPAWSPDGQSIACVREFRFGFDIFILSLDGSINEQITDSRFIDTEPDWSPDGQRIVFTSTRDSYYDEDKHENVTAYALYILDLSNGELFRLTTDDYFATNPSWSSDGQFIAYRSNRDGNGEIYLIDAEGLSSINLSNNPSEDTYPSISPDGTRIVFVSDRDGNEEIYSMNIDGTNQIRLTIHPGRDKSPDWSPDGNFIVFSSDRSGNFDLYIMRDDGSNIIQITDDLDFDGFPDWDQ